VQLAHTGDDRLRRLFVREGPEGRILVRELLRFNQPVQIFGAAKAHRPDIEALEYVQDLQCGNTLAVGW